MAASQASCLDADRLRRLVHNESKRRDCLPCRPQALLVCRGSHEHLGKIDDAYEYALASLAPGSQQLARARMVRV